MVKKITFIFMFSMIAAVIPLRAGPQTLIEASERGDADASMGVEGGEIYLMSARAEFGYSETLKALLEREGNGKLFLKHIACEGGPEGVKTILTAGVEVDGRGRFGETALMAAAVFGNPATACALIEAGADVNATDKKGRIALMLAALKGNLMVVRKLLENGADASIATGSGITASRLAEKKGHAKVAELLRQAETGR